MTQTALEISPGVPYAPLVTFTRADGTVWRYCRWTGDITIGGQTFLSEPSLKVFMDKPFGGGSDDSPIDVQMRITRAPFDKLALPYPHAKVDVVVEEVAPTDTSTRQEIFTGRISRITVKPSGMGQVAKAKVVGVKNRLLGTVGMQALTTCNWALGQGLFGNGACMFDLVTATRNGDITEVGTGGVANRVSVLNTDTPETNNDYWNRGYLEVAGLRIQIRKLVHEASVYKFDLREIPPPDWDGAACLMVPGCAKNITVCRLHGQEEHFCAPGIAMPSRNPQFEGA